MINTSEKALWHLLLERELRKRRKKCSANIKTCDILKSHRGTKEYLMDKITGSMEVLEHV